MGPAKDKHGVRESFAKVKFLFAKNGRSGIKEFWSTTTYIYIYNILSFGVTWLAPFAHQFILILSISAPQIAYTHTSTQTSTANIQINTAKPSESTYTQQSTAQKSSTAEHSVPSPKRQQTNHRKKTYRRCTHTTSTPPKSTAAWKHGNRQ